MTNDIKNLLELDKRLRDIKILLSIMYLAKPRNYLVYWGHVLAMGQTWRNLIEIRRIE